MMRYQKTSRKDFIMTPNTCSNCGFVQKHPSGSRYCPVCGALMPKQISQQELEMLSSAFEILEASCFDEAKTAFENILLQYPESSKAYWGRLRARYHISRTIDRFGKSAPICPTRSGINIFEDADYISAMTYANDQEKSFMQAQAEQIRIACTPSGLSKNREDRFTFGEVDPNDAFLVEEEKEKRRRAEEAQRQAEKQRQEEAKQQSRKKTIKTLKICAIPMALVLIAIVILLFWIGDIPVYSANGLELRSNGNGTFRVMGIGNCTDTEIEIPAKFLGMPVTRISHGAFSGCSSLTSIEIPDSVTSIGNSAFLNCSSLTSVTIGNGVTSISPNAFYGCSNLTSIEIPNSVTSIGYYAFYDCSDLISVTIGDSVTSIDSSAFSDCSSLTSITFGGTVEQWSAISFGSDWNSSTGSYTVNCSDGTISKDGTVIK